jgi:hypothetical protein
MGEAAFLNHVFEIGLGEQSFVFLVKSLEQSGPIGSGRLQDFRHEFVPHVLGELLHIVELIDVAIQFDYLVEGCLQTFRVVTKIEVLYL